MKDWPIPPEKYWPVGNCGLRLVHVEKRISSYRRDGWMINDHLYWKGDVVSIYEWAVKLAVI